MSSEYTVIDDRSGYLWVTIPDAISMYNSRDVEIEIASRIKEIADNKGIVFDFSRTNTVFSAGLGLLIKIRKLAFEKNGTVCLVNVSSKLQEMLTSVKLDKVFPIFKTDVEFEIYQNDIWLQVCKEKNNGFIFVAQIEKEAYYIHISGEMISENDLSACDIFRPLAGIRVYLINLSGLGLIDMQGAVAFRELTFRITGGGGECRVFGATDTIMETLGLLGADGYLTFYADEKSAFDDHNPVIKQ